MNLDNDRDLALTMVALAAHVMGTRSMAKMVNLQRAVTTMQHKHEAGGTAEEILSCIDETIPTQTTLKDDLEFELADLDRDVLTRMGKLLHQHRGGHVVDGLIFTAAEIAEMLEEALT